MKKEQEFDKMEQAIFEMGENAGAYILAEKIRVLLDALEAAEKADKSPDNLIIMQLMRDAITPHLPVDEK